MNLRFWHRWISVVVALPFAVILISGILLATRSFNSWMMPEYDAASASELKISFDQILEAVRAEKIAGMSSWSDVSQIDVRPKLGEIRVRAKRDHWEVVLDGSNGRVLGVGQRRVAWFTSLHQGALFGEATRYGIFLTSAFGMLFLLVSGLLIFLKPYFRRYKDTRHAAL